MVGEIEGFDRRRSRSSQETVFAFARQHSLSPSQLFTWRRELRKQFNNHGVTLPAMPTFVPTAVEAQPPDNFILAAKRPKKQRRSQVSAIQFEIDGTAVKISHEVDASVIAAVDRSTKPNGDECWAMIGLGTSARVMVATRPVDFPQRA